MLLPGGDGSGVRSQPLCLGGHTHTMISLLLSPTFSSPASSFSPLCREGRSPKSQQPGVPPATLRSVPTALPQAIKAGQAERGKSD